MAVALAVFMPILEAFKEAFLPQFELEIGRTTVLLEFLHQNRLLYGFQIEG